MEWDPGLWVPMELRFDWKIWLWEWDFERPHESIGFLGMLMISFMAIICHYHHGIQRYVNVDNSKRPQSKDMFNVDEKATWRHMTTSWHVTSMDVWPAPPPLIPMSSTLVACWNNFNRYFCRYVYVWPTNKSQTSWISPIFTNTYKLFQHISTIPKPVSTVSMCSPWTNPILPQISASP